MSIQFDEKGLAKLRYPSVGFEGGKPVDPYYWDAIKTVPYKLRNLKSLEVSKDLVNNTFNPILDIATGVKIQSSADCFRGFCKTHNIKICSEDEIRFELKLDLEKIFKNDRN